LHLEAVTLPVSLYEQRKYAAEISLNMEGENPCGVRNTGKFLKRGQRKHIRGTGPIESEADKDYRPARRGGIPPQKFTKPNGKNSHAGRLAGKDWTGGATTTKTDGQNDERGTPKEGKKAKERPGPGKPKTSYRGGKRKGSYGQVAGEMRKGSRTIRVRVDAADSMQARVHSMGRKTGQERLIRGTYIQRLN